MAESYLKSLLKYHNDHNEEKLSQIKVAHHVFGDTLNRAQKDVLMWSWFRNDFKGIKRTHIEKLSELFKEDFFIIECEIALNKLRRNPQYQK